MRSEQTSNRLETLASRIGESGFGAFLVAGSSSSDPDLAALVGPVHLGECFVVGGEAVEARLGYFTDMERDEAAKTGLLLLTPEELDLAELRREAGTPGAYLGQVWLAALSRLGLPTGSLAVAGGVRSGALVEALAILQEAGWSVHSGDEHLLLARKTKTPWEMGEIERAAQATCRAFRRVATLMAEAEASNDALMYAGEPLTAGHLRQAINRELATVGLDQPEGNIVSAGSDAGVPHSQGADSRVLRPGEAIVVDLYPKGYLFADCTRTFCRGPVPEGLAAAHDAVVDALFAAEGAACVGESGADLQNMVCERFEARGYRTPRSHPGTSRGYVHSLGHGVGFQLHELPVFRGDRDARGTLIHGDVITLEPGLYEPEDGWGVRVENLYVLDSSLRNLTPLPVELDPRRW